MFVVSAVADVQNMKKNTVPVADPMMSAKCQDVLNKKVLISVLNAENFPVK